MKLFWWLFVLALVLLGGWAIYTRYRKLKQAQEMSPEQVAEAIRAEFAKATGQPVMVSQLQNGVFSIKVPKAAAL